MRVENAASIDDLASIARRRLPRFIFDFLDGGAGEGAGVRRNREAFERPRLRMLPFVGVSDADTTVSLFGKTYAMPFGIAPMGYANLVWPGTDSILARIAAEKRIPYVLSTGANTSLEDIAKVAGDMLWFQLYIPKKDELLENLLRRAQAVGVSVLAITIDALGSRRNRDIRNNFTPQFRYTPDIVWQLMRRPAWSFATLAAGSPRPANFDIRDYTGPKTSVTLAKMVGERNKQDATLEDFRRIRDLWKGKIFIKGVLDSHSARHLVDAGADGIWVSNHGGRSLESLLPTGEALPAIRDAVGPDVPVIVDGGIRSGEDIVKARALGATMAMSGRSFAYATGAGGAAGAARAVDLLSQQTRGTLKQLGCKSAGELDRTWLL
jgi:L-lactate dehydrogenase (cytochrome)